MQKKLCAAHTDTDRKSNRFRRDWTQKISEMLVAGKVRQGGLPSCLAEDSLLEPIRPDEMGYRVVAIGA